MGEGAEGKLVGGTAGRRRACGTDTIALSQGTVDPGRVVESYGADCLERLVYVQERGVAGVGQVFFVEDIKAVFDCVLTASFDVAGYKTPLVSQLQIGLQELHVFTFRPGLPTFLSPEATY